MEEEKINLTENNEIDIEKIQKQTLDGANINYPSDKKRNLKKLFGILIPSVLVLVGCIVALYFLLVPRAKTFQYMNMEITLTNNFTQENNINFATTFQSDDMLITLNRETISQLSELTSINENATCADYLDLIVDANGILSYIRDENGIKYIEYYKTISGQGYYYRAYAYKNNGAFWLLQMICFSEDREKLTPSMQEYAASVKFNNRNTSISGSIV